MVTVSIPASLIKKKEDLVLIPRRQYESLLRTAKAKGRAKKLPAGLRQALREVEEGKLIGPFRTVKEFMTDLKR